MRRQPASAAAAAPASAAAPPAPLPGRVVVAVPEDLEGILALEHRCFSPPDRFSRATWRHLLGPAARAGTALTLVLHAQDQVVGKINALLRSNSRVLRIYSIGIDPAQRGRGLARRLLLALLRRVGSRCDTLSLEVRTVNEGARRLYEGLGMVISQELPKHYPDGGDGLRYRAPMAVVLTALRRSSPG